MRQRGLLKSFAILGVATVLVTFSGVGITTKSVSAAGAQRSPMQPEVDRVALASLTLDEQLLEVAKRDPAFGGMFFDAEGRLTMYVQESALSVPEGWSRLAEMSVDVESTFRGDARIGPAAARKINVLPGRYGFAQLYGWHEAMKQNVWSVPGVVLTDISEDQNRLRVGVERPEQVNAVRQRLVSRGIPADAVRVEVTAPIRQMATLRDKRRPLTGGIQIYFSGYVCTIGFLAVRSGVAGMVTNSHCTATQGGVQNTLYHQPVPSGSANLIGVETVDPAYFTGGVCPATRRCRHSDSAFARIPHPSGPAVSAVRGFIARPTASNGTLNISNTTPTFRITSENSVPLLNETLNKVGRTTGWSQGKVVLTCVTTGVNGTNITQICQDIVQANVAGGDSGSPVFRITNSPAAGDVKLYGVLWGSGSVGGQTVFIFSALGTRNVQRAGEMGSLTTCAAAFGC